MRRHAKASFAGRGSGAPSLRLAAPFALALAALLVLASSASAAASHPFLENFGSAAQPTFGEPEGMAVDQSNGDLLVIDKSAGTVSRYHEDGTPANFSALGTNLIDGFDSA